MPRDNTKPYAGAIEAAVITLDGTGYDSAIVSFDELSATTGTITITAQPPVLTEPRSPASNVYTVGSTTDFLRFTGLDLGSLILTPASVDSVMTYRVKFYNA